MPAANIYGFVRPGNETRREGLLHEIVGGSCLIKSIHEKATIPLPGYGWQDLAQLWLNRSKTSVNSPSSRFNLCCDWHPGDSLKKDEGMKG
jgi:hypothetical protein